MKIQSYTGCHLMSYHRPMIINQTVKQLVWAIYFAKTSANCSQSWPDFGWTALFVLFSQGPQGSAQPADPVYQQKHIDILAPSPHMHDTLTGHWVITSEDLLSAEQ